MLKIFPITPGKIPVTRVLGRYKLPTKIDLKKAAAARTKEWVDGQGRIGFTYQWTYSGVMDGTVRSRAGITDVIVGVWGKGSDRTKVSHFGIIPRHGSPVPPKMLIECWYLVWLAETMTMCDGKMPEVKFDTEPKPALLPE